MRDENWLIPEKIIDNGYHSYQDDDTGLIYTEYDLAMFALIAKDLNDPDISPDVFRAAPIKYSSEDQRKKIWETIIQPWMSHPDRLTMQEIMDKALEVSKQRYLEAISYIPEANRPKEG